jgi:LCP family protein required for cell wall assembly
VLVIIPLALVGAGVFLWNFPMLGKPIQAFPTENPILFSTPPAFTPIVEEVPAANLPLPAVSTLEAPVPGENADPPVERNAYDAWLILALGVDKVAQSDVIRLIRVDYAAEKVTVVSIPRDLFLPIPGFDDHGITQGRINAAYGYGEFFLGKGQGIISTANAFTANFGITFDRYAVGQFSSFVKLVDQVGGLDITLEEGYYGPPAGGPSFPAGDYHLYGEDTLILARVRYGDDDHHRIDRQTVILKALMGKVYDTMNLVELTSFGLETIRDKGVVTDLTVGDLYTLAQFGKSLTQEDITFVSIPREFYYPARTTTGASVILPREGLIPFIQAQLGVGE